MTAANGLDSATASARLAEQGDNALPQPAQESTAHRIFRQVREPTTLLLIVAAGVAAFGLGEAIDGVAIVAIVILNAIIGVVQEGKAASALATLRKLEVPTAQVIRDGTPQDLPARLLVLGDLVIVAAGNRVPADLTIVESAALEIDESLLTGESLPVAKQAGPSGGQRRVTHGASAAEANGAHEPRDDAPEPLCEAFSGTVVTRGSGRGLVVATGPRTRLGSVAKSLEAPVTLTPIQKELGRLTTRLALVATVAGVLVFLLVAYRLRATPGGWEQAFLGAVALAVAAIPEGLPTVVTVALALGVRRMAAHGAIIRRLPAVETLGATTIILTDKTGTLTENHLSVHRAAGVGVPACAYGSLPPALAEPFSLVAVLCNDAHLEPASGDPVDLALLEVIGPARVRELRLHHPRLAVLPFEAERKRMTTFDRDPDGRVALHIKGAPEVVLGLCNRALDREAQGAVLDEATRSEFLATAAALASDGNRILALARKDLDVLPSDLAGAESDLTFVGLVALRDPIRPEAAQAVADAHAAGITVIMVTGDHAGTARAIAREVGLLNDGKLVMTGPEIQRLGIPADPVSVGAYARMTPEQKLAIVKALRARGHVVAVTGDGVNDAPGLREADIGVAMGKGGTDVARQASDLVITDDNLATIILAVREGRGIYQNLQKVVDYLVGGNLSEVLVVMGALAFFPDLGIPLLPLQILWINFLTDGLPALALGLDPVSSAVGLRAPRPAGQKLLNGARLRLLSGRALLIASAVLGSLAIERFVWAEPWEHARALMFTVLVSAHLLYAFVVHDRAGRNLSLALAIAAGLGLQVAITVIPWARTIFGTAPLLAREWGLAIAAACVPGAVMYGWMRARLQRRASQIARA